MQTHDFKQGDADWHAHRATHRNASDAPAMMGVSPHKTRTQLLHECYVGLRPDVDAATQRRYNDGHRFEALARPLAEKIIGQPLYPVVGSKGKYSASFDGLTMAEDKNFEHKALNAELSAIMVDGCTGADLPDQYRIQMEHQHMVSDAETTLFMASKWQRDTDTLVEERHCWYESDAELRAAIISGWEQFDEDLAEYEPTAASAVEKLVAEPMESLPAPVVQVSGELVLKDNFKTFEERLRLFLAEKLIREPKTDQDFLNLDAQIKQMKAAREALKAAGAQMLAQVQPIDQATKMKDMLDKVLQQNVSMAEKLLIDEKERRKGAIVADGASRLRDHITALNKRLGQPYMPAIPADFAGAVRGLKSLSSMENKVSTCLANAKIAANDIADRIQINLATLAANDEYRALFPDVAAIVLKQADDLAALIKARIADHVAAEAKKAADREAARQKAEADKAEREARIQAESREREAAATQVAQTAPTPPAPCAPVMPTATLQRQFGEVLGGRSPAVAVDPADTRPTDYEIVQALADRFDEEEDTVIQWLASMNLAEVRAFVETV